MFWFWTAICLVVLVAVVICKLTPCDCERCRWNRIMREEFEKWPGEGVYFDDEPPSLEMQAIVDKLKERYPDSQVFDLGYYSRYQPQGQGGKLMTDILDELGIERVWLADEQRFLTEEEIKERFDGKRVMPIRAKYGGRLQHDGPPTVKFPSINEPEADEPA